MESVEIASQLMNPVSDALPGMAFVPQGIRVAVGIASPGEGAIGWVDLPPPNLATRSTGAISLAETESDPFALGSARMTRMRVLNALLLFVIFELFAWTAFKALRVFALVLQAEVSSLFHPYLVLLAGLAAVCLSLTAARALYDYVRPNV